MALNLSQTLRTSQVQTQKLNQQQIQSLKLLSFSSEELNEDIHNTVLDNPVLEYKKKADDYIPDVKSLEQFSSEKTDISDYSQQNSDSYNEFLENQSLEERETLREHLYAQLQYCTLTDREEEFCKTLIDNLDSNGYHQLAPESLLPKGAKKNGAFLDKCLKIVQALDPPGICVKDVFESLLVQARLKLSETDSGVVGKTVLFILEGGEKNLEKFLKVKEPEAILKRLKDFYKAHKELSFSRTDYDFLKLLTEKDAETIRNFITKELYPKPAAGFSTRDVVLIRPDYYVDVISERMISDDEFLYKIKCTDESILKVRPADDRISEIGITSEAEEMYKLYKKLHKKTDEQKKLISDYERGINYINSLEFRKRILMKGVYEIVSHQRDFFVNGEEAKKVLLQKEIAERISVSSSTVSRLANNKYIECRWLDGHKELFCIRDFFSTEVSDVSQAKVKFLIKKLLSEQEQNGNKISDQKLSELLSEQGIKIARRTVAKYRSQLSIDSSYYRN